MKVPPEVVIPYLPEFTQAADRNRWIREHAQYFTVIYRQHRHNHREELFTFEEAVATGRKLAKRAPTGRVLVYAVAGGHDTLVATVSTEGVREHV